MGRRKKEEKRAVYQALTMISQFGINMLVPMCGMLFAGIFLDRQFGTSFWAVTLFFAGAAAGAGNVYRMAKQIYEKQDGQADGSGRHGNSRKQSNRRDQD